MKIHTLLAVSLAFAGSTLASADVSTSPVERGGQDAVLAFCGQVNPAGASAYKSLAESLHGKQSSAWQAAQRTSAYQRAYTEVRGAMDAARADWALRACVDLAATAPTSAHH